MAGRDLSAELFGDAPGGRDLSADLFPPAKTATPAAPISKLDKVIRGVIDPIEGGAQLLTHMLPKGIVDSGNTLNNWIADKTGLVAKVPQGGMDELVSNNEKSYQSQRTAAGESGIDGYRLLGNVASPANLAIATKAPQLASISAKVGAGMMGGGASAALNPVANGDFVNEKLQQIAEGTAFGGAVPGVMGALSRVVSPNASTNASLQLLKKEGVKPTIGQTLGGWANSLEEKAQSIPLVGDAIASARGNAREQFNTAAINRATAPIGVKIEGAGTHAVDEAHQAIQSVYEQAKSAMGGFKIDPQANSELSKLRLLASSGLEGKERSTVNNYFNDYLKKPALTAESFKELDSKLTSDIAIFSKGDAYQQKVGHALQEAQRIITDNAKRANPEAAALFKKADQAWANLVRVEGASVGAKSADGVFTPGQLLTAVRGADKSVRDNATARGTALMQDLASAGQSVLGNKIPDSGTAGRLMTAGSGAAALANPVATIGGLLGGAALYSNPAQTLLRGAVSARPQGAETLADALRKASPLLVPSSAQVGLGLLNQ